MPGDFQKHFPGSTETSVLRLSEAGGAGDPVGLIESF